MIIGNFIHDKKTDTYAGDITTFTNQRSGVYFRPVEKSGEKGPNYRVVAQGGSGYVELGAAWKRTSEAGREYLSVRLDDPALPRPLSPSLMPSEDGASAILIWSRPRKRKAQAE